MSTGYHKFTGWHPFCRCYAVSILASEKELDDYCRRIENGEEVSNYKFAGKVDDFPDEFKDWVEDNDSRIVSAFVNQKLPYFLADNPENLPKNIQKRIAHISDMLRVKGNGDYTNVGFNIYTGAVRATHIGHNFDKKGGKYEVDVQNFGYKSGNSVILEDEPQDKFNKRSFEGTWNGKPFEVAGTSKIAAKNVRDGLKHCASKPNTRVAVLYFENEIPNSVIAQGINMYNGLRKLKDGQWKLFDEIIFVGPNGILK